MQFGVHSCGHKEIKEKTVLDGSRSDESIRRCEGWQEGDAASCQITLDAPNQANVDTRSNKELGRRRETARHFGNIPICYRFQIIDNSEHSASWLIAVLL